MNMKALIQAMKLSISEVLETMFFLPIEVFDTAVTEEFCPSDNGQMAVTQLNFSGPFSGAFILFIPEELALTLTADFLGKDEEAVSQANVEETSKEIMNMIAGNTFTIFDDCAVFDLKIPEKVLFDQTTPSSEAEEEIFIKINTTDNYLGIKMLLGQNQKNGVLEPNIEEL